MRIYNQYEYPESLGQSKRVLLETKASQICKENIAKEVFYKGQKVTLPDADLSGVLEQKKNNQMEGNQVVEVEKVVTKKKLKTQEEYLEKQPDKEVEEKVRLFDSNFGVATNSKLEFN